MAAWDDNRNSGNSRLHDWYPIIIVAVACFLVIFFNVKL